MRYMAALLLILITTCEACGALLVPEQYATIEAALAAAAYGDTVSLAEGTYFEHDLWLPPGVSIVGRTSDPEAVRIDAQGKGRVLEGEDLDDRNLLSYLTICNGYMEGWQGTGFRCEGSPHLSHVVIEGNTNIGGSGVGMFCDGNPVIEHCIFRENRSPAALGGGLRINGVSGTAGPTMTDVLFADNEAGCGGGFYIQNAVGYLANLTVIGNTAHGGGGGAWFGVAGGWGPEVENSLFANNVAVEGGGIVTDAGVTFRRCTIVHNKAQLHFAGGLFSESTWDLPSSPNLYDCIVAFNEGGGIGVYDCPPVLLECCDAYGNPGGNYVYCQPDWTGINGNISLDPLFCETDDPLDYSLQDTSPCAPDNNDCGVLMGAFPVGCEGAATRAMTWTRVKQLY
ncbi:MAG: right-handed parallel beta-helix repeat-containing protein [Candidatus Krumholzibacteriota bacterium]|nr:right-handed parallel beta-helix repeat-containing protein [Candidatus Krumholzibacteriota bacterium]